LAAGHAHKATEEGGDGHSHGHHLNIRAALIHVIGDLIQSIGVLISSIIIKLHPGVKLSIVIKHFTTAIYK
jgi:zinc transporter 2